MTTLRTADGETVALRDWPLASGAPRAVVLVVHGLGEHAGRYDRVAAELNGWGFAVRAADHHGHGASSGARGGLPSTGRLLDDLALVIDDTRRAFPGLPLVLLGHSLGGLVAASAVARGLRAVDALVLSSPALDAGLSTFQKLLVATLSRLAPGLRVGNGLDADFLSHEPGVAQAYRADPLCHDRIGARLARFLADEGAEVQAAAPAWQVPTLLIYAGDDRLVKPAGSKAFAAAAPPAVVTARCFPALYHEIFNEREAGPVFQTLRDWLDARFA
ncbi:alpha/beta hydrolase [Variovorax saccharolyticus]|uniref:alpha/beta hydrolase n=1 Tax=Variovorax saccharolyticus TaxID=3053516 RepID=UPI002577326C|nr:alpha/beta hydrolase [Variovorax sp. J31P216]MDM0030266.1 alpha/beta hydrolase [Variovorax sp. J31P216]